MRMQHPGVPRPCHDPGSSSAEPQPPNADSGEVDLSDFDEVTEAARVPRQAGAGPVLPLVLALDG